MLLQIALTALTITQLDSRVLDTNVPAHEVVQVEREAPKPPMAHLTWKSDHNRFFASTIVDTGYLYLRPRLSLGYGMPHYKWVGIDLNPIFSGMYVGAWAGARLALPYIDVRAGARTNYSFQHSFLPPQATFDRASLETSGGDHAQYTTWEMEMTTGVQTPYGELGLLGSLSTVHHIPDGSYVFEETLRVIVAGDMVWRVRAAYGMYPLASYRQFTIGPAVDVIGVPSRDDILVRGGIVTRIVFNRALEVRGTFMPTLVSKDCLGLITSDFTELGIRWRWATE